MTTKPPRKDARQAAGPKPAHIVLNEAESDKLRPIGGSSSDRFNNALIRGVAGTAWFPRDQSDEERNQQLFVTVTGLRAFKPVDEIEGMLAAQAMAMHHASMECSRRAMIAEQPTEAAQGFRKAAANASRAFVELLSALGRKRDKLPVSWPAAVSEPPDTGVCGCCGTRSWWLNEGGTQGSSQWVCAACHPPPVSRVVQSKWPPTVAPSPVVAEGAAVSSGGGHA